MEELENKLSEYSNKLDVALDDFRKIALQTKRQTFWEKYASIFIPTVISTIIGVSSFYAAFNLSEYKIGVLMNERTEIKKSIKNLEKRIITFDLTDKANDLYIDFTNEKIISIQHGLKEIKVFLNQNERDHEEIKSNLLKRINNIEHRIIKLEKQ